MMRSLWFFILCCLGADPRTIFRFWDGRRWRNADPLEVTRRLYSVANFHPEETPLMLDNENPQIVAETSGQVAAAVQYAFGVKPLSSGGLTETECIELLGAFHEYMGTLKKNIGTLPNSLPPMESASSEELTTNAVSASG